MIDYHSLEAIIKPVVVDDSHKISNTDVITEELVQFLITADQLKYIDECFVSRHKITKGASWHVQIKCCDCGRIQERQFYKKTALNYVKFRYLKQCIALGNRPSNCRPEMYFEPDFLCDDCIEHRKVLKEEEENRRNKRIFENTKVFVQKYLSKTINTSMLRNNIYVMNSELRCCDEDLIAEYISSLEYDHFLITPYWKIIAYTVKKKAKFKCVICGSSENLNAHHKDYSIHGYELQNIKELVCLCNDCHSLYHNNL